MLKPTLFAYLVLKKSVLKNDAIKEAFDLFCDKFAHVFACLNCLVRIQFILFVILNTKLSTKKKQNILFPN